MSLRWQILAAAVLLAVAPLLAAVLVIRMEVADDVTALDTRRVETRLQLVVDDLADRNTHLATLLDALSTTITEDNRFRLAVSGGRDDLRDYVRDYAARQLALMDLDVLLILDPAGLVVSSGHFREAQGALDPDLPRLLVRAPGGRALMAVSSPAGPFAALVRARPFELAGAQWQLVGGMRLDPADLSGRDADPDLTMVLAWPGGPRLSGGLVDTTLTSEQDVLAREYALKRAGHVVRSQNLTLVQDGRLTDAWLLVSHNRVSLEQTLSGVNRRLLMIAAVAALVAIVLAVLLAARVSRPLRDLAARARTLDLERLDVAFGSSRGDEVGQLARVLDELTRRLRSGVGRLREAEHRATLGEVARQVNHDIRNGLTPLRNVLRHLGEVAEQEPADLAAVFRERRATLDGGLAYLEDLAGHYARLSPAAARRPCDLGTVVAEAVAGGVPAGVTLTRGIAADLPPVVADPVSLRRIVENLVRNALESLPAAGGQVTIGGPPRPRPGPGRGAPAADGRRQRLRHRSGRPRPHLRRLLHHQARRQRPGPEQRAAPGRRLRRAPAAGRRPGRRHRVHRIFPPPRARGDGAMSLILIVDDVAAMRDQYAYDLKRLGGFETATAGGGAEGLRLLEAEPVDCVILDLEMPGVDGFEVLATLKRRQNRVPVIVYTGTGSYDRCVRAVKLGAYSFIDKDEPLERVVREVENALAWAGLQDEVRRLRRRSGDDDDLIGESRAMLALKEQTDRLAAIPSAVLVLGESGTGKELVARRLHDKGPRARRPFVAVNCAALPDTLVESELFGHEKGAFTGADRTRKGAFEEAAGGTLFLDEIGELPAAAQAKLLRVLEEGTVTRLGAHKTRQGGHAGGRGHQPRPGRRGRRRPLPPGPALPPQHPHGAGAAPARAPGRRAAAGRALPAAHLRALRPAAAHLRAGDAEGACRPAPGAATTCASCAT